MKRKIDHLQDLGMRKARYRGRRKTRLQALLAATVANFKRLGVLGAFDASAPSPSPPAGRVRPSGANVSGYQPPQSGLRTSIACQTLRARLGHFPAPAGSGTQKATSCRPT